LALADKVQRQAGENLLSRPIFAELTINWELAAYVGFAIIAIATRFWDLGSRAIHHDESLHALYSWYLYTGRGYVHDPMMHGPFQFIGNAFFFLLFGASDFTARMMAATFGVWIVLSPYFLRKELGRLGALLASALFAFSPTFLYFSRFTREDIYMAGWEMLTMIGIFGYLRERKRAWLYAAATGLSFMFATKESVYITGFIFVAIFALEIFLSRMRGHASAIGAALASVSVRDWIVCASLFLGINVLLYTTFFTNPRGVITGSVGAIQYWAAQQGVQRGGQPWFYYFMLLPLYEFLPLSAATGGLLFVVIRRRIATLSFFTWFMIAWFLGTLAIYTYAGEKMPWITVHITQPLIFLAALSIAGILKRASRTMFTEGSGFIVLALTGLLAATIVGGMIAAQPAAGTDLGALSVLLQKLTMWLLIVILLIALVSIWIRQGSRRVLVPAGIGMLVALFALSVHTAWGVTYARSDIPQDMLIYVQTSPDVPRIVRQIDTIANETGAGKDMPILLDGGYTDTVGGQSAVHESISWPFEWYLRDYKSRTYYTRTLPPGTNAPVILAMTANEDAIRDQLSNYVAVRGRLNWWYPEDYKTLTWDKVVSGLLDPSTRAKLWRYFFYRETLNPLGSRDFDFFVRSDLARGISLQPNLPSAAAAPAPASGLAPASEAIAQPSAGGITVLGKTATGSSVLAEPRGVAVAPDGNIYVVDSAAAQVTAFRPDGTVAYQWGKKGTGDGEFAEPWGIAVAPNGDVYVADTWNHRIQRFDKSGTFLSKWGGFADAKGQVGVQAGNFWGPRDLTITPNGSLLVADTGNKRIQVFDLEGHFVTMFGGAGSEPGNLNEPVGITVDPSGNIYVADTWNHRIQKFDSQYRPVAQFPVSGWDSQSIANKPYVAADASGRIYYTEPEKQRFVVVDATGQQQAARGALGVDAASFNLPVGIAVSRQGEVIVADSGNSRILDYQTWR
jgi:uncharacterized protein (TIGR03663 family)